MTENQPQTKYRKLFLQGGRAARHSVAIPELDSDYVLIQTRYSFVSLGTERQTLNAQASGLLMRVLSKPEESLKKLYGVIRDKGLGAMFDLAQFASKKMLAAGYSASGTVLWAGSQSGFQPGQKVACTGASFATHGELLIAPKNLLVPLDQDSDLKQVSATGVLAIAVQAFHRANVGLGQNVLILGCGVLGNFVVQLSQKAGCRTFVIDPAADKEAAAYSAGCDRFFASSDPATRDALAQFADIDAVIVTSALSGPETLEFCLAACRPRARVVIVGDGKLEFARDNFYQKELSVLASCSSGPGRNNTGYWTTDQDWPIEHVRWSARRNLALSAQLLAAGKIRLPALQQLDFRADNFEQEYQKFVSSGGSPILIEYSAEGPATNFDLNQSAETEITPARRTREQLVTPPFKTAFVGIGAFARGTLLGIVREQPDVRISAIVDSDQETLLTAGAVLGVQACHATLEPVLADKTITVAIVATPHALHARQTLALLERGLAIFVEKPLATTREEFQQVQRFLATAPDALLVVDFNRSHSEYFKFAEKALHKRLTPLVANYRVNALALSDAHWIWRSGGRIVGELCHMVEFLLALVGRPVVSVFVAPVTGDPELARQNLFISLQFADGSVGNICYTSLGNSGLPKESVELFWEGRTLVIDDFTAMQCFGVEQRKAPSGADKGHPALISEFFRQVRELDFAANKKLLVRAQEATALCFTIDELATQGGGSACVQ